METRNYKRNEQDKKAIKITDRGDNIKVTEKVYDVRQRIVNSLRQADRGDSKLKQLIKDGKENDIKNNITNKPTKNAIFQSNKGSLQLRQSKPQNNIPKTDSIKIENDTEVDNAIVMDTQIKPFLKNKVKSEFKIEKIDAKNSDMKKRIENETKKVLNAIERKRIRDKYTIRPKPIVATVEIPSPVQNESSKLICNEQEQRNKLADSKSESTKTVKDSESKKSTKSNRKPVITTIKSKHDSKVYKTVTFTEAKATERRETKPIQIKIPTENLMKRKEKQIPILNSDTSKKEMCDKATESSHNSSNKSKKKRISKKITRHTPSPEPFRDGGSPPTEVAKWAPSCLNKQTKPYYEAWVDTTLAAITKLSKKDKLFLEKQNLVESFKRMLERPESPDLIFNHMDEKYLGKIKIRQKS